jgi:chromosome segregation protein
VSRSGAAKQGALLREREIVTLREQIDTLQDREAALEEQLAGFRDQLLAGEQQREDAQRAAARSVVVGRETRDLETKVAAAHANLEAVPGAAGVAVTTAEGQRQVLVGQAREVGVTQRLDARRQLAA